MTKKMPDLEQCLAIVEGYEWDMYHNRYIPTGPRQCRKSARYPLDGVAKYCHAHWKKRLPQYRMERANKILRTITDFGVGADDFVKIRDILYKYARGKAGGAGKDVVGEGRSAGGRSSAGVGW